MRGGKSVEIDISETDGTVSVEFYTAEGFTTGGVEIRPDGSVIATIVDGNHVVASASFEPESQT